MSTHGNKKQRKIKKIRQFARTLFRLCAAGAVFVAIAMLALDALVTTPLFASALGVLVLFVSVPALWAAYATYGRGHDLLGWRGYVHHRLLWRRFLYATAFASAGTFVLLLGLAILTLDPLVNSRGGRRDITRLHAGITLMAGTQTRIILAFAALGGITYYVDKNKLLF